MARSRNIKPGFFKNEHLAELSPLTRLLFQALWCEADREGRLEDRPMRLKAEYFPYDDCDISTMLAQLQHSAGNFLVRYEVDGKRYIQIVNFLKHQNPHVKEAPSTIPPFSEDALIPTENGSLKVAPCKHHTCLILAGLIPDSLNLIPDSLIPDTPLPLTEVKTLAPGDKSPDPDELPIITLPLSNKTEHPIYQATVDEMAELYPAVDVTQQFRNMRAWLISNPRQKKTKAGIMRFVNYWLSKEQDRGRASPRVFSSDGDRPKSFRERVNEAAVDAFVRGDY